MSRLTNTILAAWIATLLSTQAASACNIPVFRYALERWQQDKCQIVVFHDAELTKEQKLALDFWQAATQGGGANAEVILTKTDKLEDKQIKRLWESLQERAEGEVVLPYAMMSTTVGRGKSVVHFEGPLDKVAKENVMLSPARKELRQRLLSGHSVVWVMIRCDDPAKNREVRERLLQQFKSLSKKVQLPDGIGLPGSELYAEVPLLVKFSLLEIDPRDPRERFLVVMLRALNDRAAGKNDSDKFDEPLLAPVFGRGRVLEVLTASQCSEAMVEDMTAFLSGPCSCQVKSLNPGFDLLLPANWQVDLFGVDGETPPDRSSVEGKNRPPVLLQIPPGRKRKK